MSVKTFEELVMDELEDIYDAEKQLVRALPKIAKECTSLELRSALEAHLSQTEEHVERLDGIFLQLGSESSRKTCKAMAGLLSEGESLLKQSKDDALTDAAIIAVCQKVEHYEMATYGTLREWSRLLGREEIAATLQTTLNEEFEADQTLTRLSQNLNVTAAHSADRN